MFQNKKKLMSISQNGAKKHVVECLERRTDNDYVAMVKIPSEGMYLKTRIHGAHPIEDNGNGLNASNGYVQMNLRCKNMLYI